MERRIKIIRDKRQIKEQSEKILQKLFFQEQLHEAFLYQTKELIFDRDIDLRKKYSFNFNFSAS